MATRLLAGGLLLTTTVLAALLVLERHGPAIVDQQIGPTRCHYDTGRTGVVLEAPFAAATQGRVSWEVRAQVLDRTRPSRQPYVATRIVSMSTGGHTQRTTVALAIKESRSEWLAGHDDCEIEVRTIRTR